MSFRSMSFRSMAFEHIGFIYVTHIFNAEYLCHSVEFFVILN